MENKLLLIDGNSIAFRAFYALPLLHNEKGIYTNAVYGFTNMLLKVLEEQQPTHALVAFDAGKTTFRHDTYREYKGGRQKTPPELSEQIPYIQEVLDALGISRYEKELYEADDIIGTLAKQAAAKKGWEVVIVTGDRDLLQLVDERVRVLLTKKGISDTDVYNQEKVQERYGFTSEKIVDMKGLMGDSSDNIPGVPGIGEKTAIKLLKQFGTLENVLASIENISGKKMKERLQENAEQARMSKELARIETDAPLEVDLEGLCYKGGFSDQVIEKFKELGFSSLIERVSGETAEISEDEEAEAISFSFVEKVHEETLCSPAALVVEMVGENYHKEDIIGIALAHENGCYYLPTKTALKSEKFVRWLEDENQEKIVFDAKRAVVALRRRGIELSGVIFDSLIASYLLNPSESNHDLSAIASRLHYEGLKSDESFYGKGAKLKIPEEDRLASHLARKAHALYHTKEQLLKGLRENEQDALFFDLEMPLSLILGEMESYGVKVDVERLKRMGKELNEKLKRIEQNIHRLAGTEFNINSPKQLGEILFDKLNLPVIKKTKTGYSTSAEVLEKLKDHHEIIGEILHYRQLGKLESTYIEGLLKVVDPSTEMIHTRFNQALTQTGRLSSTDPNLQNIPIRLEEGRKIRQAFVPREKGWLIFSADYSQIELRVLAHIAADENLLEAFAGDMDIHTKTAMDVFGVEEKDVTPAMRRQAKAVNFGIVYGISDYGLSQNLGITRQEARAFIDRYFESFPKVKEYMEEIVQKAKRDGYVTTIMQRRRYLPDITSRNFNRRSFAERTAMNTPIQGSAADIIKKAMIDVDAFLKSEELNARMLLQVHDELIFEAPEKEIGRLEKRIPDIMENAVKLKVPLKVDYAYGPTWYDAK